MISQIGIRTFLFISLISISFISLTNCRKLPVIAILANAEPDDAVDIKSSRVNFQYVRWLEQSLADVVVIQPWYTEKEVEEILSKVNAVLWQGGDRNLTLSGQFEKTARIILNKVIEKNDQKNYLPLWGTCQGFELLHGLVADTLDVLTSFNADNYQAPLILNERKIRDTKMFSDFSVKDILNMQMYNVTSEYHHFGVETSTYLSHPALMNFFKATTLAKDIDGKLYIGTMESRNYPIYGSQFHPEMVQFTKDERSGVPQSLEAVKLSQSLSMFLIKESMKNKNVMSVEEMNRFDYINSFSNTPVYNDGYYYYYFNKTISGKLFEMPVM
jgi:gamma-glutamyl hydrolase